MWTGKKLLGWAGTIILQLVLSQVATFVLSFLLPLENRNGIQVAVFVLLLTLTFSTGVFVGGLLGMVWGWVRLKRALFIRWLGALGGAAVPLIVGALVPKGLEPDSIFFLMSIFFSTGGFFAAGSLARPAAKA